MVVNLSNVLIKTCNLRRRVTDVATMTSVVPQPHLPPHRSPDHLKVGVLGFFYPYNGSKYIYMISSTGTRTQRQPAIPLAQSDPTRGGRDEIHEPHKGARLGGRSC